MLPGLILQDTWRFAFLVGRKGWLALVDDVVWVFLHITERVLACARVGDRGDEGGLFSLGIARVVPRLSTIGAWWRSQRELCARFIAEFITYSGVGQLVIFLLGVITTLSAVGALRGAIPEAFISTRTSR